jgi:hypothetical protein
MNDERLNELLNQLEEVKPAADFTASTLARLDRHEARQRQTRPVWVLAFSLTAILLVAALGVAIHLVQASAQDAIRMELLELRHEHDRLHSEMAALRERMPESQRYVYLGQSDRAGYVLDLERWNELQQTDQKQSIPSRPIRY